MLNYAAKYAFTAASIAPVFITMGLLSLAKSNWNFLAISAALAVLSVVLCLIILRLVKNGALISVKTLDSVTPADKEITNYFLTYLFPLICGPDNFLDWKVSSIFYGSLFFYINYSSSYSFNPILAFFGYKFYEAEDNTGVNFVLITKKVITDAKSVDISVQKISEHVYLKSG